ncbi:MAG: FMN-binding negative transcriptional regulator [Gallionellaceae bacterium]|jgi:transcriptional regulator
MYIPESFAETDLPTLHEFMRRHSFATLVTQHDGLPFASHLPLSLDSSIGTHGAVLGHMARNNEQWRDFADGAEVLVIFQGAHAYVSPSWYEPNPMSVPTWNFTAVHAYGKARILSEDELRATLHQLVDENERAFASPWKLELTQAMQERMLGAIVGFEIGLSRIEGKFKLSQNRSVQDRKNIIAQLQQSAHGKETAQWMSAALERE